MDLRQERGRLLSLDKRIKCRWRDLGCSLPTSETAYFVNAKEGSCSCPDYELRRCKCKHQFAVEFSRTITTHSDGSQTVTKSFRYSHTTERDGRPTTPPRSARSRPSRPSYAASATHRRLPTLAAVQPIRMSDAVYAMVSRSTPRCRPVVLPQTSRTAPKLDT